MEALKGIGADASPRRLALGTCTNADAADYFQTDGFRSGGRARRDERLEGCSQFPMLCLHLLKEGRRGKSAEIDLDRLRSGGLQDRHRL